MHGQPASGQSAPPPDASNLNWALYYATRGRAVLPVYSVEGGRCTCGDETCNLPGKHARGQLGVEDASTNSLQICLWWRWWPGSDVGIANEVAPGVLTLDIDPRNGGDVGSEVDGSPLPTTLREASGTQNEQTESHQTQQSN